MNLSVHAFDINYKVLARSSETDSYKMPAFSPLRGVTPQINDNNEIAFKVPANLLIETEKIFFNTDKDSKLIYESPRNTFLSDPVLTVDGIIFTLNDTAGTKAIMKYFFKSEKIKTLLEPNKFKLVTIYEVHQNEDAIYFRAKDEENKTGIYSINLEEKKIEVKTLFKTGQKVQGKKISYIFPLDMNGRYGVCKVRFTHLREDAPDLIVRLDLKDFVHKIIIADKDFSKRSKYTGFRNSSSVNKYGSVALIATTKTKTKVLLNHFKKDDVTTEIATTSKKILSISHFSPDINNFDVIVFRAKDSRERENVYIANTQTSKKIMRQYQIIRTDKKKPAVLMHRKNTPVFGGHPKINNKGTIVVNTYIRHLDTYTNEPLDIQSALVGVYDAPSLLK